MNIAFAGFRHGHIFSLYNSAAENPNINIVGSFEQDDAAREQAIARGVSFNFKSYDEILKDKSVDAVAIGERYGVRGDMVIKALSAGKHVVADKPLCTSLCQLDEIERLADEKKLKVGCMLDLRYMSAVAAAREVVLSGRFGAVRSVSFGGQHCLNYGTRASWYFEPGMHGGTINDIAIHGVDLVRYITGAELKNVLAARCWNAFATKEQHFKDSAQFMAVLDGDIGLIADVSYSLPANCNVQHEQVWRFTFWGDNGVMEFNCAKDELRLALKDSDCLEVIKDKGSPFNTLTDFMADIDGNPNDLDTDNVLRSTRFALSVQSFAC